VDALADRGLAVGLTDSTRAALSRLADFFNTPVTPPG
jgi:hypothetical protein